MDSMLIYGMGLVMVIVGIVFLYILLRSNENHLPKDGVEWAGSVLSVGLVFAAVLLMAMAAGTGGIKGNVDQTQVPGIQDITLETPAALFPFKGVHDGEVRDFSAFKGKVILVNFWATWCGPCLSEIPDLNRLQAKYAPRGLTVISISSEPKSTLVDFERQLPMQTTTSMVPEFMDLPIPFTGAFNVLPSSFVIDRDGTVRRYLLGARNYDFFESAIQPYL